MFRHLLIPLDGSPLAESALPAAMEIASRFGSQITLLRVVPPFQLALTTALSRAHTDLLSTLGQQASEDAALYLKGHQGSLRQQGYRVRHHLMHGEKPAELILQAADGLDIDSIVMSTHGRGGFSRWMFGSVANKVVRRAMVPVLLIRAHAVAPYSLTQATNERPS